MALSTYSFLLEKVSGMLFPPGMMGTILPSALCPTKESRGIICKTQTIWKCNSTNEFALKAPYEVFFTVVSLVLFNWSIAGCKTTFKILKMWLANDSWRQKCIQHRHKVAFTRTHVKETWDTLKVPTGTLIIIINDIGGRTLRTCKRVSSVMWHTRK